MIVSRKELTVEDDKIAVSFGKTPLSDVEKDDMNKIFIKSLGEEPIETFHTQAVKNKLEYLNENITPVNITSSDLTEFDEWENEAKQHKGW